MNDDHQVSLLTKVRELLSKREEEIVELRKTKDLLEETVQERTNDLQKKLEELEKINKFMVDREIKMMELKNEIKLLKQRLGEV